MEESTTPKKDLKTIAIIVYACWAAGIFSSAWPAVGVLPLVGVLLAYLKTKESTGTIYHSHFVWVFRTFIIGLIAGFVAMAILMVPILHFIGFIGMIVVGFWSLYRLVKGALKLYEGKGIDTPEALI